MLMLTGSEANAPSCITTSGAMNLAASKFLSHRHAGSCEREGGRYERNNHFRHDPLGENLLRLCLPVRWQSSCGAGGMPPHNWTFECELPRRFLKK